MISLIEDTRQKETKHETKHRFWDGIGVKVVRSALPFGDYMAVPSMAIDTKQDISEIAVNMCGTMKERHRFANECRQAQEHGCKLVFLIEDKNYNHIDDLYGKQIFVHGGGGKVIQGDSLAKGMHTAKEQFGCEFLFCDPKESARIIMELLAWAKGMY